MCINVNIAHRFNTLTYKCTAKNGTFIDICIAEILYMYHCQKFDINKCKGEVLCIVFSNKLHYVQHCFSRNADDRST